MDRAEIEAMAAGGPAPEVKMDRARMINLRQAGMVEVGRLMKEANTRPKQKKH